MERFGDMAITEDLKMCLESEMLAELQECIERNWFTAEEAQQAYADWHKQFEADYGN
jgi:hypothetical protein